MPVVREFILWWLLALAGPLGLIGLGMWVYWRRRGGRRGGRFEVVVKDPGARGR